MAHSSHNLIFCATGIQVRKAYLHYNQGKDLELMVAKAQSELDEKLKEIANREAELAQREKEVEVKLNKKTSKEV